VNIKSSIATIFILLSLVGCATSSTLSPAAVPLGAESIEEVWDKIGCIEDGEAAQILDPESDFGTYDPASGSFEKIGWCYPINPGDPNDYGVTMAYFWELRSASDALALVEFLEIEIKEGLFVDGNVVIRAMDEAQDKYFATLFSKP